MLLHVTRDAAFRAALCLFCEVHVLYCRAICASWQIKQAFQAAQAASAALPPSTAVLNILACSAVSLVRTEPATRGFSS